MSGCVLSAGCCVKVPAVVKYVSILSDGCGRALTAVANQEREGDDLSCGRLTSMASSAMS
jgi:hypothetical protein